jgi:hypothetical protein
VSWARTGLWRVDAHKLLEQHRFHESCRFAIKCIFACKIAVLS